MTNKENQRLTGETASYTRYYSYRTSIPLRSLVSFEVTHNDVHFYRESIVTKTNMVQDEGATSSDYQYNVIIEDDDG